MTALDAAGAAMLAAMVVRAPRSRRLAVAATHAPLGLPAAPHALDHARNEHGHRHRARAGVGRRRGHHARRALGARARSPARTRSRAELAVQLLFYIIVVSLFPLATTPERTLLATMGPGVLWVAALLASLLVAAAPFRRRLRGRHARADRAVAVSARGARRGQGARALAHDRAARRLLAPLLGVQYALDGESLAVLSTALLLGTPVLSLLGAIGAALRSACARDRACSRS